MQIISYFYDATTGLFAAGLKDALVDAMEFFPFYEVVFTGAPPSVGISALIVSATMRLCPFLLCTFFVTSGATIKQKFSQMCAVQFFSLILWLFARLFFVPPAQVTASLAPPLGELM